MWVVAADGGEGGDERRDTAAADRQCTHVGGMEWGGAKEVCARTVVACPRRVHCLCYLCWWRGGGRRAEWGGREGGREHVDTRGGEDGLDYIPYGCIDTRRGDEKLALADHRVWL